MRFLCFHEIDFCMGVLGSLFVVVVAAASSSVTNLSNFFFLAHVLSWVFSVRFNTIIMWLMLGNFRGKLSLSFRVQIKNLPETVLETYCQIH